MTVDRKHIARSKRAQSYDVIHRYYLAAKKAVGPMRGGKGVTELERFACASRHNRKVADEFHRRLKRAGIRVEVARG